MKRITLTALALSAVVLGPQIAQAVGTQPEPTDCTVVGTDQWQAERYYQPDGPGTRGTPQVRSVYLTISRCADGYVVRHKVLSPWRLAPLPPQGNPDGHPVR